MFKFITAALILNITCLRTVAQEITSINWGAAASQKYVVSEAQGRAVNGKLYSFGGFDSQKSTFTPTKRAYVYDPVANKWTAIADLPFTPNGTGFGGVTHAGITTDGTDIYIAGGYTSNSSGTGQIFGTKQVWKYIISQNSYTKMPDLPISIAAGQLEYLDGKLHFIAGTNAARTADLGNHYVLDLSNLAGGWKTLAPLPNPRQHAGSVVYGGKIYFIGGQHEHDAQLTTQKDVHVYNPATNAWIKVADLPVPAGANGRAHISSGVAVAGDRIIVLGGEIAHQNSINMVSAYSPATNSWTNLTPLPKARYSGVAGYMIGNIFYTGGSKTNTTFKGVPVTSSKSVSLLPLADAFVRDGNFAASNYGKDTSLIIKGSAAGNYTRLSYLKFSLDTISVTNIVSAKLRVYGSNTTDATSASVSSYGVNTDTWTEIGITFSNAPKLSTTVLSSAGVNNANNYYEFDVTEFVKTQFNGDKVVSFVLKDTANQNKNIVFNSRENSNNKPQLIISTNTEVVLSSQTNSLVTSANSLKETNKKATDKTLNSKKPIVYPNPFKSKFNIKFPDYYAGNFSFEISDAAGRTFYLGKLRVERGGVTKMLDISQFPLQAGVGFLKIKSETVNEEIKLIIQ